MFRALALRQSKDEGLWRRANARNVSQHTLYGVHHIHINLTLIHCIFVLFCSSFGSRFAGTATASCATTIILPEAGRGVICAMDDQIHSTLHGVLNILPNILGVLCYSAVSCLKNVADISRTNVSFRSGGLDAGVNGISAKID